MSAQRPVAVAFVFATLLAGCGGKDGTVDTRGTAPSASSPSVQGGASIEQSGVEGSDEERAQAARTARAYLEALAVGEWARACSRFSAATRDGLKRIAAKARKRNGSGPTGCAQVLRAIRGRAERSALCKAADIRVCGIRVEGARANLLYEDGEGTPSAISMAREGSRWRVADIGGGPLTQGSGSTG